MAGLIPFDPPRPKPTDTYHKVFHELHAYLVDHFAHVSAALQADDFEERLAKVEAVAHEPIPVAHFDDVMAIAERVAALEAGR